MTEILLYENMILMYSWQVNINLFWNLTFTLDDYILTSL